MSQIDYPRVTIVMTARERYSLTLNAIDSVIRNTPQPYRFIYLDAQSPAWLNEKLDRHPGLEIIHFDEPLWPQEARARIAPSIETEYVVFIDNDVEVEPGWLDALVTCADETGAGIVGPLYLWGDGVRPPTIHMAGGKLVATQTADGKILDESHYLVNESPEKFAAEFYRRPCDFAEYHCMLVRSALIREKNFIDPAIRCVHEHIDTALAARRLGYPVFLEPSARVNFLAFKDYRLADLAFFRERWSEFSAEASIGAFAKKWDVTDDDRSFGKVRQFLRSHRAQIDPIRPVALGRGNHAEPMRREELMQTRSDLLDFALARGYATSEVAMLANAYHVAHVIVDGGYRPCGRPFINHLVGTASALVRYDFRAETVAAGMLHAAYTHCPPYRGDVRDAANAITAWLGGRESPVEERVRAYTLRSARWNQPQTAANALADPSLLDAEVLAIAAANEVDMHLSGEYRYTQRADVPAPHVMQAMLDTCRTLGAAGLAKTLQQLSTAQAPVPLQFVTATKGSYRISQDRQNAVGMVSNVPSVLQ